MSTLHVRVSILQSTSPLLRNLHLLYLMYRNMVCWRRGHRLSLSWCVARHLQVYVSCTLHSHRYTTTRLKIISVGMQLVWSSGSQRFSGHAMTHEELTTLCDVYQTLNSDFRQKQTSYILQTLWRDLTSEVCSLTDMSLPAVTCS